MKNLFTLLILLIGFTLKSQNVFESITTGNWNAPATWTLTSGTDADGIPDNGDSVIIHSSHVVKLVSSANFCRGICILNGGQLFPNTKTLQIEGGFYNAGTVSGGSLSFVFNRTGARIESLNPITIGGNIYIKRSATIVAGTVISLTGFMNLQNTNTVLTNNGSVSLRGGSTLSNNSRWINNAGSSLTLGKNLTRNGTSKVDFTATTNTVTYNNGTTIDIDSTTYNTLVVTGSGTKRLRGITTVNGDMTIAPSSSLTLVFSPNGKKLILKGNISNTTSSFQSSVGDTLLFTGSAATQTVDGTRPLRFYNVIIDKPNQTDEILCNNNLNISHELNVIRGTCNSGADKLTLLSDASSTARLAAITTPTDVDFTGSMVIQRFYPTYTHPVAPTYSVTYNYFYHDLSSPVQSTTVNDWDNEIYISGIGVYDNVAGPAGVDGDVFNGAASMNTYNQTNDTWTGVTGSTTTLTPGQGYDLLLLDDNDNQSTQDFIWNGKVIDSRGVPNFGNVTIGGLTRGGTGAGWNLIGNPYASPIMIDNTSKLAITGTINGNIYFPNPDATGAFAGAYETVSRSTATISPHQGFFIIRASGSNAAQTFTFTETAKVASYGTTSNFQREVRPYDIKLTVSSANLGGYHACEVNFDDNASLGYDEVDAIYKQYRPIAPNIYFAEASGEFDGLMNNYINSKDDEVVLPMKVFTPEAGMYTIDASVLNIKDYKYVWIENKKTGEKYDINKSMAIEGKEQSVNTDYVLHLSKKKQNNAISQTQLSSDLLVFNTENILNLKSTYADHQLSEVTIYDMSGKLVLQESNVTVMSNGTHKIDLTNLTSGVYVVRAIDNNGQVISKKIVK
jgi:hypothetical protein